MVGAGRLYAAVSLVGILAAWALAGCQSEENRSLPGVQAWLGRLEEFYHRHQRWPDRLEDLQEYFDTPEQFQRALHNPVTREHPGYEYIKPPDWVRNTPLAERVVIVYQLRQGRRAADLPVGYANGQVRLVRSTDITQTQANWQPFRPPEAPVEVAFPTPPVRDAASEDRSVSPGSADTESDSQPQPPTQKPASPEGSDASVARQQSRLWSYRATFCGLQYMLFGMQSALLYRAAQEDPYPLLDQLSMSLTQQQQVEIRHRQKLQIQKHPALDLELVLPELRRQVRVRWCLAGDRLYCLCVTGPDGTLNKDTSDRFFQSFRLVSF